MAYVLFSSTFLCLATIITAYFLRFHSAVAEVVFNAMDLKSDNSLTEIYGHGLAFLSAGLFLITYFSSGSRAALLLAVLCGFIWVDDAAQYHESAGHVLVNALELKPAFGLRPQDMGEMLAWAIAASLIAPLAIGAVRNPGPGDLGLLTGAALCFGLLMTCGVVFDMINTQFGSAIFTLLEDGGELVALTCFCILAVSASHAQSQFQGQD